MIVKLLKAYNCDILKAYMMLFEGAVIQPINIIRSCRILNILLAWSWRKTCLFHIIEGKWVSMGGIGLWGNFNLQLFVRIQFPTSWLYGCYTPSRSNS